MDKIEWSDKLSVGVKRFDEQHGRIIGMINTLIEGADCIGDWDSVDETLDKMVEYSKTHFGDEEKLMKEYGYAEANHQEDLHFEFMEKTVAFTRAPEHRSKPSLDELLVYLRNWWVGHILVEDMKYKQFFADKGLV